MSSSLRQFSPFMNKAPTLSFHQWQKNHQKYQQKQDRLLWSSALIGSSIFLMGIAWIAFHLPHQKPLPLTTDAPPAIMLDLSADLAPPPPPPMAAQPEAQPLEDQPLPIDAPTAPNPDITLPKTQAVEKIKPVEHKKIMPKQPKIVHAQKATPPVQQATNTATSSSNTMTSSSSNSASSSSSTSNASSQTQSSMSPATWQSSVLQKLERLKRYPSEAQSDKQEGITTIKITINRQGHVLASKLAKSSGYSLLDKEAVALAYRADPLPAVPDTIKGNSITLNVPIEFYLK